MRKWPVLTAWPYGITPLIETDLEVGVVDTIGWREKIVEATKSPHHWSRVTDTPFTFKDQLRLFQILWKHDCIFHVLLKLGGCGDKQLQNTLWSWAMLFWISSLSQLFHSPNRQKTDSVGCVRPYPSTQRCEVSSSLEDESVMNLVKL